MAPSLALGGLQRWMQSVIVHPGDVEDALASTEAAALVAPERLGEVVLPSASLSPEQRVGVYQEMYLLRMEEALETDYPALAHFLGPRRWKDVVRDYVEAHPSRSYTLNVLGRHLAEHLATRRGLRHAAFLADLARLEWAITEAFDAPETGRLGEPDIAAVSPDAWEGARLVPAAATRLVALRHNAGEYLDSIKGDAHDHPRPRRRSEWIAVSRRDYAVYRLGLGRTAFRLLSDLVEGWPVGEAVQRCLRTSRPKPSGDEVFGWFREWAHSGLFQAIEA
jgi:Putative DNA-binding domain